VVSCRHLSCGVMQAFVLWCHAGTWSCGVMQAFVLWCHAGNCPVVSCRHLSCGVMQALGLVVSCRHEQEEEKIGRIVGMDEAQTTGSATRPYHYIVSCDAMQA